jgi:hypothetical protein
MLTVRQLLVQLYNVNRAYRLRCYGTNSSPKRGGEKKEKKKKRPDNTVRNFHLVKKGTLYSTNQASNFNKGRLKK